MFDAFCSVCAQEDHGAEDAVCAVRRGERSRVERSVTLFCLLSSAPLPGITKLTWLLTCASLTPQMSPASTWVTSMATDPRSRPSPGWTTSPPTNPGTLPHSNITTIFCSFSQSISCPPISSKLTNSLPPTLHHPQRLLPPLLLSQRPWRVLRPLIALHILLPPSLGSQQWPTRHRPLWLVVQRRRRDRRGSGGDDARAGGKA